MARIGYGEPRFTNIGDDEYQRWYMVLHYAVRHLPFFSMFSDKAQASIVNSIMVWVDEHRVKDEV